MAVRQSRGGRDVIEIRADEDMEPAHPDGPQSSEQTRAIASGIDEALRLLNYATMNGRNGIEYPSTVYSVLGVLAGAVGKLPQALDQMLYYIAEEVSGGRATENAYYGEHGGDALAALSELKAALTDAVGHAEALARSLGRGQSSMRGMESTADGDGA
jgi:hypothetical protein